jgi:hypothetical protein
MDPDQSNQPQEREQESAQALLDLAEVIPREDPGEEGVIY